MLMLAIRVSLQHARVVEAPAMEEMSEGQLEQQLEEHLLEQRESLNAVEHALGHDATNSDLLLVREELLGAVKGAEESLLQLKRARLFREVEAMADLREADGSSDPSEAADVSFQPATSPYPVDTDAATPHPFVVGGKCRFRHSDGRWYNGRIMSINNDDVARLSFLYPTTENMQVCRFYLQQQCRFGSNCRLSHGVEIPLLALHYFKPTDWKHIPLGTSVLAESGTGLWRLAELESWDNNRQQASIVFTADGFRKEVGGDDLAASEQAYASDLSEYSSGDKDSSDGEREDEQSAFGSFFGVTPSSGIQTETVTFAHWEKHTRGVASKMMASMGFHEGMGLGTAGQGITEPVRVQILPSKQSVEFANESRGGNQQGSAKQDKSAKKKSRGGKRKRDKKWAAAARAAKAGVDGAPNVFDYINHQLAGQQNEKLKSSWSSEARSISRNQPEAEKGVADRRMLIAHEDEIKDLQSKVGKLQEMAARNRKDKVVYDAVDRKLIEARKALHVAEAAHASTTHVLHRKEEERKWLRF